MVRDLAVKMILSAVGALAITFDRSEVITFSLPIAKTGGVGRYRLFIKKPGFAFNLNSYIEPIANFLWICIGIFCVMGSLTLWFIIK